MFETFDSKQYSTIKTTLTECFNQLDNLKKEFRDKKSLAQLERINNKRIKFENYIKTTESKECLISELPSEDKQLIRDFLFDFLFCLIKEKNTKSKLSAHLEDIVVVVNNVCM